jgi:cytidylate kinase
VPRSVVCISHTTGSDAEEVANRVAEQLGYLCVEEEIIAGAAAEGGFDPREVADEERRKSFAIRMLDALSTGGGDAIVERRGLRVTAEQLRSGEIRALIRETILQTAARGNVVILAHAASYVVDHGPHVLRVFVTASPAVRARRLAAGEGVEEAQAARMIKDSDAGRADYLERFYGVDHEAPADYDLVINTDTLSTEHTAELVVHAAGL